MAPMVINEERFRAFAAAYERNLARAVREKPAEYSWPIENVPKVAAKMLAALRAGTHNHNGFAFTWTCRELGIPHTRKAIAAYLAGRESP